MATNTRDEKILREIAINLIEETGGMQNINEKPCRKEELPHLEIYREFLSKLEITENEVKSYACCLSTKAMDEGIRNLYTEQQIEKSLGAMYALETMSGIMCSKLNQGLKHENHDESVRYFFELHSIREQGHANGVFNAIVPYLGNSESRKLFEEGVEKFLSLLEQFWDGVSSICQFEE